MRYQFIKAEKANVPAVHLCRALNVSRSSFYDWLKGGTKEPSRRDKANAKLRLKVLELYRKSGQRYGRPKLLRGLRRAGIRVGENRLRRIMVQNGIWGRKRAPRRKYNAETADAPSPNLVGRNFTTDRPDQTWCGDITQFRIGAQWLFVATVIDLYSRRVVGLSFGRDATTELVVRAMLDALRRRKPSGGTIFHTDRGVQYRSQRFRRLCMARGLVQSMSRAGNCLDNAVAESFFATLEHELASRTTWGSLEQAELEIRNYVFDFYNQRRMHASNDYLSPAEFETENAA